MTQTSLGVTATAGRIRVFGWVRHWPGWAGYAAALWSLGYGVLGLYWTFGGARFPFAPINDDLRSGSILEGHPASTIAPIMASLGLFGAVAATWMVRSRRRHQPLLAFGWIMAAGLTLLIPDYTMLFLVAFAPVLVVFIFTGIPGPQGGIGDIVYWHRVNLIIIFVGGLLWAATAIAYQRRTSNACSYCGRGDGVMRWWATRDGARRWGRWAVWVAVLSTIPYEVTRIAWFFGLPLGISRSFERDMQHTPGMLYVGLACAVGSIGGGLLTHGLVARWGEVYPRWIWFRAGRRVPPALAIVPASIVAVVLMPASWMNIQFFQRGSWGATGPGILWLLWGAGLGAATFAYYLRRRSACRRCGRGEESIERPRPAALAGVAPNPVP